jgi:hypothetical protein
VRALPPLSTVLGLAAIDGRPLHRMSATWQHGAPVAQAGALRRRFTPDIL